MQVTRNCPHTKSYLLFNEVYIDYFSTLEDLYQQEEGNSVYGWLGSYDFINRDALPFDPNVTFLMPLLMFVILTFKKMATNGTMPLGLH